TVMEGENNPVSALAFSPDGKYLAAAVTAHDAIRLPFDAEVRVWDAVTGRRLQTVARPGVSVYHLAFSPDGKRLAGVEGPSRAAAKVTAALRVWDAATGAEVLAIPDLPGRRPSAVFSPDGKRLATWGTGESVVRILDVATGEVVQSL